MYFKNSITQSYFLILVLYATAIPNSNCLFKIKMYVLYKLINMNKN